MSVIVNKTNAQLLFEYGIRGGVNLASFNDSKQEIDSRRIGILAGVYGKVRISSIPISIQPEVLYSQKGAEINGVEVKLSYIEIPILARVNLSQKGIIKPHIYLGPYLGFNLNYEEEPSGDLEEANNMDYGLVFGAGINVKKLNVGLRYSLGLKEIFEIEEERNNVIAIIFGYGI